MIAQLQGKLVEKNLTDVVIDCGGVGYFVEISLHTYSLIPDGELIKLFTFMQVREDSQRLFGFMEKSEREVFKLLLSVSGIGASTARTMLSSLEPRQIAQAIASGDVRTIQSVKGIGAKGAQRVILDLKDKILQVLEGEDISLHSSNTGRDEALSALETLGYLRKQAQKVVDKILASEPDATVEKLIKGALKQL
ncbi:Holliday junction branch migration protein RuvA [Nonlabens ulvanivorans]|uniref:Holliday junction branch migration complex subunit RuvA n=1 Tax=Nonlabens ulvanivorans TaxID=906888 RepID=A0A084JUV5_NONUL|nr:Holliday junction branch migration protein RuvA [Nonlabens ulvanivorans]KEZ92739.1 ATP-dependent DNA helicase RuvA [Nonlabens ulvanivorans]PRX15586.1 Holliday junction DNA helicase subunit RuvA [Nonlabens ulvanivorans]WOI22072.1 Holliday junction branch migration protein RuvA [Nonlabens ulvanivorans]GAK90175.1 Holliday junction DNA helicase RuvA [Nonlabens ulvanivorans]